MRTICSFALAAVLLTASSGVVATGQETVVDTDAQGRYRFETPAAGTYLVIVSHAGFSDAARTEVIERSDAGLDVPFSLEIGVRSAQVSISAAAIQQSNTLATGDALASAVNVTPVGNGPFGIRPRLRGLDSTRLLVLVDGERLNTARQAPDRTGAEVGLISPDSISRVEIINGAGTLMYGSDALAGTSPRVTFRVQAGAEKFDNYKTGQFDVEDTTPLFTAGTLERVDTIDNNFGFAFKAFPDPFNAPYVRTDSEILKTIGRISGLSGGPLRVNIRSVL